MLEICLQKSIVFSCRTISNFRWSIFTYLRHSVYVCWSITKSHYCQSTFYRHLNVHHYHNIDLIRIFDERPTKALEHLPWRHNLVCFVNLQKYNNALEGKQLWRKYTRFPVKANIRYTLFLSTQNLLGQRTSILPAFSDN